MDVVDVPVQEHVALTRKRICLKPEIRKLKTIPSSQKKNCVFLYEEQLIHAISEIIIFPENCIKHKVYCGTTM